MDTKALQLDDAILMAHEREDAHELVDLYAQAAELKTRLGEQEAAAFLYTQAYVFALESGNSSAAQLRQVLVSLGREAPDADTNS